MKFSDHAEFIRNLTTQILEQEYELRPRNPREVPRWTESVKRAFYSFCHEADASFRLPCDSSKVDFYGTLLEYKKREWLLDVVIYVEPDGALVAVESEMDYNVDGIELDFMKLLSFKAPLKILIVDTGKQPSNHLRARLQERATAFKQHQPPETYYFINFHQRKYSVYCAELANQSTKFEFKRVESLCGIEKV